MIADNSSHKIEDLPQSIDSWWRTQSATMALLKHAHLQIGTAEKRIADMEKRIRELEEIASTDGLTGLMNRRGFERFFANEQARLRREQSRGALLVLFDLDRFKAVNDLHGHPAGDACLNMVSQKLVSSIRLSDVAARFGGDEFALLLTQADTEQAEKRALKIAQSLNDITMSWNGHKVHFGASVGTAVMTPEDSFELIYERADADLYVNKKGKK